MALEKMGNHKTKTEREKNDFYATNPYDVEQIIDILCLERSSFILEPCAGEGHISKKLKSLGYKHVYSNDLIERNYFLDSNIDFLKGKIEGKFNYVITNPPFKYAKEFIEKSLEYADTVIILAKLDLLETSKRKELNNKHLQQVYVHSKRAKFALNGDESYFKKSSSMSTAWFVYKRYKIGITTLEVIE